MGGFWALFTLPVVYLVGGCFLSTLGAGVGVAQGGVAMLGGWQFNTLLAAVVPVLAFVMLTLSRPSARAITALFALGLLVSVGFLFVLTTSLILMLVAFELLLLVSLYLLRLTAKSDRVLEAALEMFF